MSMNEVEILYSPSKWSKRYSPETICQIHTSLIQKASEKIRSSIPCALNIAYGENPRDKFDIIGTNLKGTPILIFVHGGYWQEAALTHDIQSFVAEQFYKNNIQTICIGYELCPQITLPQLISNIQKAVTKCLEYAKENNSSGIHLAGHSAGAHLVISLFEDYIKTLPIDDQKLFKSSFLLAGVYDLVPLLQTSYNEPLKLDETTAKATSPMFHDLYLCDTKFHVVAAENDSPAFVKQSEDLHKKLVDLGFTTKYHLVRVVDHFDLVENLRNEGFELTKIMLDAIRE